MYWLHWYAAAADDDDDDDDDEGTLIGRRMITCSRRTPLGERFMRVIDRSPQM